MTMPTTVSIDPFAVYTAHEVRAMLDLSVATLTEARRSGKLRSTKKGRRVLILGEWVLDWLRNDPPTEGSTHE
jgi:hypothetical protein